MEPYLLIAIAVLLAVAIVLIIIFRPKKDTSTQLLAQQLELTAAQTDTQLTQLSGRMQQLTDKNYEQQIKLMETLSANADKQAETVDKAIASLQESNEKKLEEMRKTVDEKLTETLDKRINASFHTVSEQLKNVYQSLGEMKELSSGVTENVKGLNRVLTNVKARGTWAEVQLGNILDQTIPGMYETNVKTNPKYSGQVEFAVRIPNAEDSSITWLPIDSKFPMEDYARLSEAAEKGDLEALEASKKALETRIKNEAKHIKEYISVPETTPFAIMYLATEGLYAEVMSSKTGLAETLQAQGVMVSGPSTITALLNSLAMGFRSIAINKRASEVFEVLGAAKAQYEKFGEQLALAKKRIESAGSALEDVDKRNDLIQKKLRNIESLDEGRAESILGIENAE